MIRSKISTFFLTVWKTLVGVLLCQNPLGAVAVVGWTSRLMRRRVLRSWWKKSPRYEQEDSFEEFVESMPMACPSRTLPNWSFAEPAVRLGNELGWRQRYFGSLSANFRQGLASVLAILLFTLPATSLWLYSWVLGWNISFFKLYEQSDLGALNGISGILLFGIVMLYVPLAHARHALSGNWRDFFQLRRNWQLVRRYPATMLPVAIAFVIATDVVMILRVAPYFLGSSEQLAELSVEQLQEWLNRYHLFAGALLLPAYILVWAAVAGAYARAVVKEYAQNRNSSCLSELECETLAKLQIATSSVPEGHPLLQGARTSLVRLAAGGMLALSAIAWFAVAGQVFVAQFLNYLPGIHWLNHPLVLLPWIKYVPPL